MEKESGMGVLKGFLSVLTWLVLSLFCVNSGYAWTITAIAGSNGSISPSGPQYVPDLHNQSFTITPDPGYEVNYVDVDFVSVGAVTSYIFNSVTADHSISAYFKAQVSPVASFVPNPPSNSSGAPVAVQFNDTSTGNPTSYLWDFGDGETSTEQNPMVSYPVAGTYPVSLTVANAVGGDTITVDYIVSACLNLLPVRNESEAEFDFIMNAYSATVGAGLGEIRLMSGTLEEEDLFFDSVSGAPIALRGGYDCSFQNDYMFTSIPGSLTISASSGPVTVSNIKIIPNQNNSKTILPAWRSR